MKKKLIISLISIIFLAVFIFIIPYTISKSIPKIDDLSLNENLDPTEEAMTYKTIVDAGYGDDLTTVLKNTTNKVIEVENTYKMLVIYYLIVSCALGIVVIILENKRSIAVKKIEKKK